MNPLRPSGLSALFFLILLALQLVFSTSYSETWHGVEGPSTTKTTFGHGPAVVVRTAGDERTVEIRWGSLLSDLLLTCALALLGAAGVRWATGLRRPGLVYLGATLGICLVAFLVATGISRYYWGYFLSRPSLPSKAREMKIDTLLPVETRGDGPGERKFVRQSGYSVPDSVEDGKEDPYYCLDERILVHLEGRGLLPDPVPEPTGADLRFLEHLFAEIEASGVLAEPEEGYDSSSELRGVVVRGSDPTGERILFVGLRGGQVSNDHYPCYELVFRPTDEEGGLTLLASQRFFFDLAGIEGMEWYVVSPFLCLAGLLLGLPTLTVVLGLRRLRRRRGETANAE